MERKVKNNTVYYTEWDGTYRYIVRYTDEKTNNQYIELTMKIFGATAVFHNTPDFYNKEPSRKIREATPLEIRWLEASEVAGKYVDRPKEEIINNYEIY